MDEQVTKEKEAILTLKSQKNEYLEQNKESILKYE